MLGTAGRLLGLYRASGLDGSAERAERDRQTEQPAGQLPGRSTTNPTYFHR